MTTAIIEIGTLIDRSPKIRGGRPTIAETGVTVRRIVSFYLGLISLGIYQVLPTNSGHPRLRQMGYWLVISSLWPRASG
jgi:hypothetical protein